MTVTTPTTATQVQATLATLSTLAAGTYRLVLQRSDMAVADIPVTSASSVGITVSEPAGEAAAR